MKYFLFRVKAPQALHDIFVAELAELGFDMMQEKEDCVEAFAEETHKSTLNTDLIIEKYGHIEGVSFETGEVENENWNENWEKNYQPITVNEKCHIRANFHPPSDYSMELIITPRMSFGTGHHATTYLMAAYMLNQNFQDTSVLDAGTGTGVLAIMAEKLGAEEILAYDVSELCVENTLENMKDNDVNKIKVLTGTIKDFDLPNNFDFILANINRNAIIEEMEAFSKVCSKDTKLVFSGFYERDLGQIERAATINGLIFVEKFTRNDWCCAVFQSN